MCSSDLDGAWWLATPLWAPRSPYTFSSSLVWYVYSDGDYFDWYYYYTYGVRPAIVLNSSLLVSYEGEEEEIDLEKVPNELFMEEVERRWKNGAGIREDGKSYTLDTISRHGVAYKFK